MDNPLSRRTVVFVVRIWAEYLEQASPAWRGEIEHVESGAAMRFGDVGTMLELLQGFAVKSKERDDVQL